MKIKCKGFTVHLTLSQTKPISLTKNNHTAAAYPLRLIHKYHHSQTSITSSGCLCVETLKYTVLSPKRQVQENYFNLSKVENDSYSMDLS